MNASRFITTIIFVANSILAFAEYDGRLVDDPYHKSPTWLYVIITICVIYSIVKGFNKRGKSTRTTKAPRKNNVKPSTGTSTRIYQETGRYWDLCPICKGSGWIDGKEVSYLVSPPETVCCDKCKGYGHELTLEAERLHLEYSQKLDKEYAELRRKRAEREKQCAEERQKQNERKQSAKLQAIAEIRTAGRQILREDDYPKRIAELRASRKEKYNVLKSLLKDEPLCPSCKDGEIAKDCPTCRGTGHIPTPEANEQINDILEISNNIKLLCNDYRALYPQELELRIPNSFIDTLSRQSSRSSTSEVPESTLLRNRIVGLLKDEPFCKNCMASGQLKVRKDFAADRAYEQIACSHCNGKGRLYYNE